MASSSSVCFIFSRKARVRKSSSNSGETLVPKLTVRPVFLRVLGAVSGAFNGLWIFGAGPSGDFNVWRAGGGANLVMGVETSKDRRETAEGPRPFRAGWHNDIL